VDAVPKYGTVPRMAWLTFEASSRCDAGAILNRRTQTFRVVPSFVAWLCKAPFVSVSAANGVKALIVLVVEDEFFVRYDIATCLREAGYFVVESRSGEDAIARYSRSAPLIDIVLTDINLGGSMSGWDVAERFRMEQPDIPLLYMSRENIDAQQCLPGSVFLAKPANHEDILSACWRLTQ
jgi:CheY-like chemotaxis protein